MDPLEMLDKVRKEMVSAEEEITRQIEAREDRESVRQQYIQEAKRITYIIEHLSHVRKIRGLVSSETDFVKRIDREMSDES